MINKNPTTPATAAATTATRPMRRSPRAVKTLDLAFSSSVFAKRFTLSIWRCLIRLGCTWSISASTDEISRSRVAPRSASIWDGVRVG